jgi:hypothetical protein
MERSSINLNVTAVGSLLILGKSGQDGLGIDGQRAAQLKIIMKRITPRTVPCGDDPGRRRSAERTPRYLRTILLSVR